MCYGQVENLESSTETVFDNKRPAVALRYYPLGHLHYYRPTLQFGIEPRLAEKWGVNFDIGFLHENFYLYGDNQSELGSRDRVNDLRGYYAAIEPRFYPYVNVKGRKSSTFFSISFDVHDQEETRTEWFHRYGNSFRQYMTFTRSEQTYTQMIKIGTSLARWNFVNLDFSAVKIQDRK